MRLLFIALIICMVSCRTSIRPVKELQSQSKVLFICTNESSFNGHVNGTYLEEIAIPIYNFHNQKVDADIVSPLGGAIPVYYKFDTSQVLREAIDSKYYQEKIAATKSPSEIVVSDYSAVVVPGGYGQFIDLHHNDQIKKIIVEIYEQGGFIGSIGHGTALLAQLRLKNGAFLVNEVTMTCFPNWNERNIMEEADRGKKLPFLMEDELRKNGADLKIYDHEKKINYEITDSSRRVVTASFASSGDYVSNQLIRLMQSK